MPARTHTHLTTAIALLAFLVALGGTAVAATAAKNSVTSKSIKDNAVKSKDVKNDGLTGKDIKESTLATVPRATSATSVGGVTVTPVDSALLGTSGAVPLVNEGGDYVSLDCSASSLRLVVGRVTVSNPMLVTTITPAAGADTTPFAAGDSSAIVVEHGWFHVTMTVPEGGSTTVELNGTFELNGDGTNDCFYRGTITRTP